MLPFLFSLIALSPALSVAQCPPLGSTLPLAPDIASSTAVRKATADIDTLLQKYTASFNATAVTLTIGTVQDETPFLEFHNGPSHYNTSGSHNLTTDTQFVLASVSKLFTAYGIRLLSDKIDLTKSILEYVPQLNDLSRNKPQNAITTTDWSAITVDALLSHLAGIDDDLGDSDIANAPGNFSALGLPPLSKKEQGTGCGDASEPYQRPCTEADFLRNWGKKYPAYAPYTTPVYSNVAYGILAMAIEKVSGVSFAQYIQDAIISPLGLRHTSVDRPLALSDAFITAETADGDISEGFLAGSGAIYSSANDLFTLGRSILSHKLLTPVQTRAWLKPRTFTSSTGVFVGEVWEIARGPNLTGGDGHIVDFYTKGGNLDGYSSLLALAPDYGLAFAITSAGPDTSEGAVQALFSKIAAVLVPALEAANKAHAKAGYAGTYTSGDSSVTLAVDEGPGLLVREFRVNGVDGIVGRVGELVGATAAGETTLRLYPTGLTAGNASSWQGVYDVLSSKAAAQEDSLFFFAQGSCQTWSSIDLVSYGLRPLDQFILTDDGKGRNVEVEARAWRTVLSRA